MKKIVLALTAAMLVFSLAACTAAPEDTEDPNTAELEQITVVLDWYPNPNHTGLYVAEANGYFAEQGLDVEIVQPGDNYALQLVAAGQAEFGVSYQEEVTFARETDIPVVSIAAVIQHNTSCFAAPKDNNISTIADFAGKTYGSWGGLVEEPLINYLVESEGLSDPVEVINIGTTDFFTATETTVDFSWIYYATTGIEAELRGVELDTIYLKDIDPTFDYYTPVLVAEESWLVENSDIAERFLAAVSKGYQFADSNPDEAADILLAASPESSEDLIRAGQQWMAGKYQDDAPYWGYQSEDTWQDFADWLYERGLIENQFDGAAAFTNQYLPAAADDAADNTENSQE